MAIVNFTNIPADFLYKQINKADIILVDLDGVVFTPVQYVCSSYWYVNYVLIGTLIILKITREN